MLSLIVLLYTAGLPPVTGCAPVIRFGSNVDCIEVCNREPSGSFTLCLWSLGSLDLINGPLCWCWPTVVISLFHVLHHREVLSHLHGEGPSCIRTLILESIPFMFALKARKKPNHSVKEDIISLYFSILIIELLF